MVSQPPNGRFSTRNAPSHPRLPCAPHLCDPARTANVKEAHDPRSTRLVAVTCCCPFTIVCGSAVRALDEAMLDRHDEHDADHADGVGGSLWWLFACRGEAVRLRERRAATYPRPVCSSETLIFHEPGHIVRDRIVSSQSHPVYHATRHSFVCAWYSV
jgi:hypothetical protein